MNATITIDTSWRRAQTGAALIVSLLFLLILTVTGITAMLVSSLEERMSGNLRSRNLAFQAAEAALRQGESDLVGILSSAAFASTSAATFGCTGSVTYPCVLLNISAASDSWNDTTRAVSYSANFPNISVNPKYIIEVLTPRGVTRPGVIFIPGEPRTPSNSDCVYRVTSRGTGSSSVAVAIVQSTYRYPFKSTPAGDCHG